MAGTASMSSGRSRLEAIKQSGSAHSAAAQWYVHVDGAPEGPHDLIAVRELLRTSRINADTSVNRVGTSSWTPMRDDGVLSPYVTTGRAMQPVGPGLARRVVVEQRVDVDALLRQHGAGHIGKPAGFWIRTCAYILDAILLVFVDFIAKFAVIGIVGTELTPGSGAAQLFSIVPYLAVLAYFVMFNCGGWQATPGKRVLGVYIRRVDGHTITIGQAIGRYFATGVATIPFGIGLFMVGWNSEKKGLHDMMCGTRVVHGKL